MQFVVPQFINVEPKILGPITPRQLIILIITFGLGFVCFKLADLTLFILEAIILLIVGGGLAFAKVNKRPLHLFLFDLIKTVKNPNLRVWQKELSPAPEKELKIKEEIEEDPETRRRRPLLRSKLSQISLLVDTGGKYQEEDWEDVV
ncbi:PrgI family protein [Patescibacteria group bacterium]|nr:PrgI family protein [Patescibacteria group bacterium]